jgi:aminoglycoside phosphotransferase family enzyme/predicted kinase
MAGYGVMSDIKRFETICRAMTDPDFYPHKVSRLERRETHISVVFLTGKWVYKLKKPVKFDFLDFRNSKDRRRFCEREVLLNQRLSKDVYIEVTDIYQDESGKFSLLPNGSVVEYAVKMLQLPEGQNLWMLLKKGPITNNRITSLGRRLSAFYETAEKNSHIDRFGCVDLIQYNMEENFKEIDPFVKGALDRQRWEFVCQVCRSFIKDHVDLFQHRIDTGGIRDGHGDLRSEHVYFHKGIQVIDCIEFNDRFRFGDTALDLAFLHMDLDHLGYPDLGRLLLAAYAETSRDWGIYALLDFYAAYRALVRLKVSCYSLEQKGIKEKPHVEEDIKRYMNQAYEYAVLFGRPTLWVFFGLPASGKSTLSRKTAEALFIPLFQSDGVRKKGHPEPTQQVASFNTGLYRPILRGRVYSHLLSLAQEMLKKGRSVILDATFSQPKWRESVHQLAGDMDTNVIWVECACKTETIVTRLKQRELLPGESDARLSHFKELADHFSPFKTRHPDTHFTIDTDQPVEKAFIEVLSKGYASKRAQVKSLLEIGPG